MPPVAPCVRRLWPSKRGCVVATALACLPAGLSAQVSGDGFPRSSFPEVSAPRPVELVPLFFPPIPPPLDRPAARGGVQSSRFPAPPELQSFQTEFFYPMLGTRLATGSLSAKQRARVDAYRADKLAQLNELRAELARLRPLEASARAEGLAAFARKQTPRLAALENTAEEIRRELLAADFNWSAFRQWHLNDKERRGFSPREIGYVMRATAYYQNNVLPAQRWLLCEIAVDLAFAAESTTAAAAAHTFIFFPPEPARVAFPDDISHDVAAKVAAYQTLRSTLKKELYDAVYANDGGAFGFLRGNPLKALGEKQAGRFAELEKLAEEIRRGLAAAPESSAERSPLHPALDARVGVMVRRYQEAQKDASTKIETLLAGAKSLPMQASYRFEGDGLKFIVVPGRGGRGAGTSNQIETLRKEISAVADDYGRTMADLLNERESIRQEIAQSLGLTKAPDIDRVLLAAMRIAGQRENQSSFSEYRTAVFEPGLAPEQRRLLFDGVVQDLNLPLPRGEPQPTYRGNSW